MTDNNLSSEHKRLLKETNKHLNNINRTLEALVKVIKEPETNADCVCGVCRTCIGAWEDET